MVSLNLTINVFVTLIVFTASNSSEPSSSWAATGVTLDKVPDEAPPPPLSSSSPSSWQQEQERKSTADMNDNTSGTKSASAGMAVGVESSRSVRSVPWWRSSKMIGKTTCVRTDADRELLNCYTRSNDYDPCPTYGRCNPCSTLCQVTGMTYKYPCTVFVCE